MADQQNIITMFLAEAEAARLNPSKTQTREELADLATARFEDWFAKSGSSLIKPERAIVKTAMLWLVDEGAGLNDPSTTS